MEFIKIIDKSGEPAVNARDLHNALGSKRNFATWFKSKVRVNPLFQEGKDWVKIGVFDINGNLLTFRDDNFVNGDNQIVTNYYIEYALTLPAAKKLAMMENTKRGNQVRDYFLKVERERNQLIQHKLPSTFAEALRMLAREVEAKERLEHKLEDKKEKLLLQENVIKENAPKVEYYENVLHTPNAYTTTTVAKEMGMAANSLHKLLKKKHIMYRVDGHWVLSHMYQNKGYTKTRTYTYTDGVGMVRSSITTVWTQKGREFLHKLIKHEQDSHSNSVVPGRS